MNKLIAACLIQQTKPYVLRKERTTLVDTLTCVGVDLINGRLYYLCGRINQGSCNGCKYDNILDGTLTAFVFDSFHSLHPLSCEIFYDIKNNKNNYAPFIKTLNYLKYFE